MNIAVCIKQVPDVPNIRIDEERMTVNREGVESIINPGDKAAVEAALQLKEKENGRVTVLSMGPPQSEEALREALAMGADVGILISDPALAGSDTWITSRVLARALSKAAPPFDLILCGTRTIDSDTGHVGPQVAEELGLPQVCYVTDILCEGRTLVVRRLSDGFQETLRVTLPALLTLDAAMNIPRHVSYQALENAFSHQEVLMWDLSDLGLEAHEVGLKGSATTVVRLYPPPDRKKGEVFSGSADTLVEIFIRKLEELSILDEEEKPRG